ncbi:YbdD/YjiX family protein [Arthrobacter sp. lap29]|uniref:YbdD/YjiX family protein n=1 Tax=Arthrobacter sp. lap29 TaxID=3056122 RepID=UPI0028F7148F|nr:YbdD/YjiX family protein [Arthrobacter sp. lap29]
METLRRAAEMLAAVNKYFTGVLGADAYERYLEHHSATRCEAPALSVKEFWRDKNQRQDTNPEGRCC